MSIRIIFSDIDGTLLNNQRVLSSKTISIFKKLKKEIPIILISARMPKAMRHLQAMGNIETNPIIAYNGGLILVNDKVVHSTEIPNDVTKKITQFNPKIHFSLYHNDDWYVPQKDYWALREINNTKVEATVLPNKDVLNLWSTKHIGAHKIMCMGNIDDIDRLYTYLEKEYPLNYIFTAPNQLILKLPLNRFRKKQR